MHSGLSIRAFLKTRQQFKQVLSNSNSGINMSRYFRLMALASTDIVFSLPFSLYLLVSNLQNKQDAWVSWDVTHAKFSIPTILPMIILKTFPSSYKVMMINIWVLPAGGFLFFIYFGLGGEALSAYKDIFFKLVAPCGIRPKSQRPVQRAEWYVTCLSMIQQLLMFGYRKNQVSSLGSSTRSEVREARFPSVPDLDESDHEEKMSDDLEAGKARSIA
jgi:pheromone a factor receptor